MISRRIATTAAVALMMAAVPAAAQDQPPPPMQPPAPPPGWVDPQAPHYPGPAAGPQWGYPPPGQPLPPGAYPDAPGAYRAAPDGRYEGRPERYRPMPAPYPPGPGGWHGAMGSVGPAYGYPPEQGYAPGPCGCAAYAYPPVAWVQVPVETRYRYSPPIRHVTERVERRVINRVVTETRKVPVRVTKYVKTAKPVPTKMTKSKVVRTTK